MSQPLVLCWLRRDLRLHDHAALYHALRHARQHGARVQPLFIFDTDILQALPSRCDRRVDFIQQALCHLDGQLAAQGAGLRVCIGAPLAVFGQLLAEPAQVIAVFTSHDYEPAALARDLSVQRLLAGQGVAWHSVKDQVIFETNEVLKDDGTPYTVFTPYSKKWRSRLSDFYLQPYPSEKYTTHLAARAETGEGGIPTLADMGFQATGIRFAPPAVSPGLLRRYAEQRDIPGIEGTSRLGIHLRFGTGSVRALARQAQTLSETFLNELIWRDFFQMLLWHYPHSVDQSFKPDYDAIAWRNVPEEFDRWKSGTTGYPLVDAGMRELHATGFMHNRVRMSTASFLCKHLLIDWRWGERYFAEQLLDYDQAANVGNWQWAAGSGADAAPYFRIFNPHLQAQKFDAEQRYIRQWVPEFGTPAYPPPMVEHALARQRCLAVYQQALKS